MGRSLIAPQAPWNSLHRNDLPSPQSAPIYSKGEARAKTGWYRSRSMNYHTVTCDTLIILPQVPVLKAWRVFSPIGSIQPCRPRPQYEIEHCINNLTIICHLCEPHKHWHGWMGWKFCLVSMVFDLLMAHSHMEVVTWCVQSPINSYAYMKPPSLFKCKKSSDAHHVDVTKIHNCSQRLECQWAITTMWPVEFYISA